MKVILENLTDKIARYIFSNIDPEDNKSTETSSKKEYHPALSTISVRESIQLSTCYAKTLQIKPEELVRYLKKSTSLAICYAGFSQNGTRAEAIGAGKAAFLSCAYDVASDWEKPQEVKKAFVDILQAEVSPALSAMAIGLLDRDLKRELEHDGLERGIVATHFVLELMGAHEAIERKINIDKLGIALQIVDDVLDYDEDLRTGDTNCLASPNRNTYLTHLVETFRNQQIELLFPNAGILGFVIRKAWNKAKDMLESSQRCP